MFSKEQFQSFLHDLSTFQMSWNDVVDVKKFTKDDQSPVTEIDHAISDFFKRHRLAQGFSFYSEEEHGELSFPGLILDPLDGTRDFIAGRPECAVSAAWMESAELSGSHFALISNPFTGFQISSQNLPAWRPRPQTGPFKGLVSRSEWERGLYRAHAEKNFQLQPLGSIAFKLGLLSSGACDFVVSLRPKNVWDIAAGTILAHERGFEFWSRGARVGDLSQAKYEAPLVWARPELIPQLLAEFSP